MSDSEYYKEVEAMTDTERCSVCLWRRDCKSKAFGGVVMSEEDKYCVFFEDDRSFYDED